MTVPINRVKKNLRNGRYQFRAKVPLDLVEAYGQLEEKRSLGLVSAHEANQIGAILSVQFDARIAELRRRQSASDNNRISLADLDTFQINRMVTDWMSKRLAEIPGSAIPEDIAEDIRDAEIDIESLRENDINASASILDRATRILADNDVRVEHREMSAKRARHTPQPFRIPQDDFGTPQYQTLYKAVRRALIHILKAEVADASGEIDRVSFASLFGVVAEGDNPVRAASPDQSGPTLGELKRSFDEAREDASDRKRSSKNKYGVAWRVMREVLGEEKPVADLSREDFKAVFDVVKALPPKADTKFRGLTLVEASEAARSAGVPPMAPKTANGYMDTYKPLIRHAVRNGWMSDLDISDFRVNAREWRKDRRQPFTVDELNSIFSAPLYAGCQDGFRGYKKPGTVKPRNHRFWIPLISLFSGMRLGEIAQLHTNDIVEQDGVWCFNVTPTTDSDRHEFAKDLKTQSAERIVPIHPQLQAIGIIAYADSQRKARSERLFPDAPIGSDGTYSQVVSKWFGHFLTGAIDKTRQKNFHSFRHTFTDALRLAGVKDDHIDMICGWHRPEMRARYGQSYYATLLAPDVAKVSYEGLDLGHINAAAKRPGAGN